MCSWYRQLHNYQQSLHNLDNIDDIENSHYHIGNILTNINRKIQMVWRRRVWC